MQLIVKTLYGLLIALAVGLVVLLLALQYALLPGYELFIVRSGSMEPAIATGSLVIVKEAESYRAGDIITFGDTRPGSLPTTHRIVSDRLQGGEIVFETKGDANESADEGLVPLSAVRGVVALSIPRLGYLLDFARQPLGFSLLIGVPAALIIYDEVGTIIAELRRRRTTPTV
jgi:signal peptidase